jgi:hypothetical protein
LVISVPWGLIRVLNFDYEFLTSDSLLEVNVRPQRHQARDDDVDAEVEHVTVDQEGVGDESGDVGGPFGKRQLVPRLAENL